MTSGRLEPYLLPRESFKLRPFPDCACSVCQALKIMPVPNSLDEEINRVRGELRKAEREMSLDPSYLRVLGRTLETLLNKKAEIMAQKYNQNANNSWQTDPRSGKTEYAQIAPHLRSDTATGQRLKQEYQAIMDQTATRRTVKCSTRIIPSPPAQALIQFIGGPKNAEQEYMPYGALPNPVDIMKFSSSVSLPSIEIENDGTLKTIPGTVEYALYRMTPIPMDQTPFSDAQIIVAVFQELKTA